MKTQINLIREPTAAFKRYATLVFSMLIYLPVLVLVSYNATFSSDTGTISKVVAAVLVLVSFKAIAWWIINTIWPVLANYTKEDFGRDFKNLSPLQKVLIAAVFYVLVVYALIATLGAIN